MEAHLAATAPGCNVVIKSPRALISCQHVLDFHFAENSLELNDLPELDYSIFGNTAEYIFFFLFNPFFFNFFFLLFKKVQVVDGFSPFQRNYFVFLDKCPFT